MNYAAARHLVPSPGPTDNGSGALLPWETDADTASARQETWLLSFIDILALLLTLFVLLLAYQDREPAPITADTAVAHIELSLSPLSFAVPGPALSSTSDAGFAMPGEGLLPLAVDSEAVGSEPLDAQVAESATAVAVETPAAEEQSTDAERPPASTEESTDSGDAPRVSVMASPNEPQPSGATTPLLEPAPVSRSATDELLELFRRSALGERVEVTARPGAVSLEISDSILFTPASAALSAEGMAVLDQLAGVLRELPYTLSVEGHSDNVPIHTVQYPSNWELSAARAAVATRKLIEQGVAAERVRAIGYGDTRPRSDNGTLEGRAKNRRVTFVLQVESQSR